MRALICREYGPPESLVLEETDDPVAGDGEIVVAGIPGEEATVKTLRRRDRSIVLQPANQALGEMVFAPGDVEIYGRVVTVMRKL